MKKNEINYITSTRDLGLGITETIAQRSLCANEIKSMGYDKNTSITFEMKSSKYTDGKSINRRSVKIANKKGMWNVNLTNAPQNFQDFMCNSDANNALMGINANCKSFAENFENMLNDNTINYQNRPGKAKLQDGIQQLTNDRSPKGLYKIFKKIARK